MESYRPQSPDLSPYQPQSPDLSGLGGPASPDLSGLSAPAYGSYSQQQHPSQAFGSPQYAQGRFHGAFGGNNYGAPMTNSPTSVPSHILGNNQQFLPQHGNISSRQRLKSEDDDDYMPDAPTEKRGRGRPPGQSLRSLASHGPQYKQPSQVSAPLPIKTERSDPTLGVNLKTSFPVARIKRIMQNDEDIGKVAQVTPHVVSRALELFMIKLISSAAAQAQGNAGGPGGKGPKRVLAQHVKRAVMADDVFDFLHDIVNKVPDAPSKVKKDAGSDSEDTVKAPKKGKKKRKDSGDDF